MTTSQDKLTLTSANTEYSYQIPPQTKSFGFKIRSGSYDLKYYFVTGAPSSTFSTLGAGSTQLLKGRLEAQTIFFQCENAGEIVEIEIVK